jgi:hypothetical protein
MQKHGGIALHFFELPIFAVLPIIQPEVKILSLKHERRTTILPESRQAGSKCPLDAFETANVALERILKES